MEEQWIEVKYKCALYLANTFLGAILETSKIKFKDFQGHVGPLQWNLCDQLL